MRDDGRHRARRALSEALERRMMLTDAASPVIVPLVSSAFQSSGMSRAALGGTLYESVAEVSGSRGAATVAVSKMSAFALNMGAMKAALAGAPMEFTTAAARGALALPLPTPEGNVAWFKVVEAPIMEEALAANFPEIKTYRGVGIDDPTASVRLDYTPAGFHAQVLSAHGSYYIDPYYQRDAGGTYASYYKRDLTQRPAWDCEIIGDEALMDPEVEAALERAGGDALSTDASAAEVMLEAAYGSQLRTYRAAVATSGEYTTFHGGTVTLGQSAVVTAMNRVNGVYEMELAIRMVLVANNNLLIYTNKNTDPYSNSSNDIDVNTGNINSVIGVNSYDIGHVFTTASGGVAYLGSVGNNSIKGGGTTGTPTPVGDPFTIDYVAHEMGHQFGAHHTFNTTNSNRTGSTAYEPGSGSTIMAYAGILGNENLQLNSDPYFHSASMDEIRNFVTGSIPGIGTVSSTGNSAPTVSAGVARTLPTNTPFMLTASGSDPDGDAITFEWQERELGPAALLTASDNGSSPQLRDWVPTTSPSRMLPRLSSILNGTNQTLNSAGRPTERLYSVSRSSSWRVIARDNRAGGGGVATADVTHTFVNTGAAFAVTAPNTAVTWDGGSTQTVTWNVAGTTANGINTASVNILLSTDGGSTFPFSLASGTANDSSQAVTMPTGIGTSTARVKVEAVGNIFFDIGNANFTITNVTPLPGTIAGQTFEDRDSDGVFGAGDVAQNGVVVYLDDNLNGALDGGEPWATTSGAGNFSFGDLEIGTYRLRQQLPAGHIATSPANGFVDIAITSGASITQNIGNFPIVYSGTAGNDQYELRLSPTSGGQMYNDNFNRATLSGGSHTYTTSVTAGNGDATIVGNVLTLTNDKSPAANSNGIVYTTTPTSAFAGFNQQFDQNSGVLTWRLNMQQIRPNPGGLTAGSYGAAYVLGATNGVFSGNGSNNGYAVAIGNASSPDPIRLVKFAGGLSGSVTTLAQDAGQEALANYWSVKVTYDPATDQWALFTRDDGASAFSDPAIESGYVQSGAAVVDSTYVNVPLTHSGAYWAYSTSANQTAKFDNIELSTATVGRMQVLVNGMVTYSAPPALAPSLTFDLGDGADELVIEHVNDSPIPSGGVSYIGGDASDDVLTIEGTAAAETMSVGPSAVSFGGTITYGGVEKIIPHLGGGGDAIAVGGAGAAVWFDATQQLASLTITAGAIARMQPGGSNMIVTDTLDISGSGSKLDLADNDLVVTAGPIGSWNGSTYGGIAGLIQSGRSGGGWIGDGIITSMPAASSGSNRTTLAVASGAELFNLAASDTALWNGETVFADSVIVKYTYAGDLDLDGDVDGDDYFSIDSNVAQSGIVFGYAAGDIDFDGDIDGDDYFWIDGNAEGDSVVL